MIQIKTKDLCYVGSGEKLHIKYTGYKTYCSAHINNPLKQRGATPLSENSPALCHNCLREYKRKANT